MIKKIENYIEHTQLNPSLTSADIEKLVTEAIENNFHGICIPPFWVKKVARDLSKYETRVVTVIGFPLGYGMTETKLGEMKLAIDNGAHELDMVMNISAFKSKMPWTKIDIAKCAQLAHEHQTMLKVIIETAYLSDEEIIEACKICQDAGADFVKTSTGMAPAGAKIDHVRLMRKSLAPDMGIKASGGIRDYQTAKAFIEAGADRIGTSSGVKIISEYLNLNTHGTL